MRLSWQLEQIIKEITEACGTPDGDVKIPVDLLRKVGWCGYLDGQLESAQEAVEKVREANRKRTEELNRAVDAELWLSHGADKPPESVG